MKLRDLLVCFLVVILGVGAAAQDVHFTQFDMLPTQYNAAQTGAFEGTYRIGFVYRGQWFSGVTNGIQTPALYADVPFNGFRKMDWIGIGLNVYQDKIGASALTNTLTGLSLAYHFALDKRREQVFSFGLSGSYVQRKIDLTTLAFQDGIQTGTTSVDAKNIDDGRKYIDFNLGVDFRSKIDKFNSYNVGVAMDHFLSPGYNLERSSIAKFPARFTLHGQFTTELNKSLSFMPGVLFQSVAGVTEAMVQAIAGFKLDKEKTLRGGIGYRVGDAAQLIAGLDYGDFRVSAAYDVTLTDLRKPGVHDGFEIGLMYIGKVFKTPNPPAVILCPRF